MIRLPKRLVDRYRLDAFLEEVDCASLKVVGESLILDIGRDEMEFDDWDDGSGWLAALAPLRAEVLAGDLRLFYLLWLTAVQDEIFEADTPEPMPGIGPITGPLEAFAEFFGIDPDLVQAAAERGGQGEPSALSADAVRAIISAMPEPEKTLMLSKLYTGDAHVAVELRAKVRQHVAAERDAPPAIPRTVGELRARAAAIGLARQQAAARKREAERKRAAEEAEKARQARLTAIARRGEGAWRDVEAEIARSNASAYDRAASLLIDLRAVAEDRGTLPDFEKRLRAIRERHARKQRFIERLVEMG
jgi:hypothetical protein